MNETWQVVITIVSVSSFGLLMMWLCWGHGAEKIQSLWIRLTNRLLKNGDKIKIWEFRISKYGEGYLVKGPGLKLYFSTPKEAANHICENYCNPIDTDVHYDCECCPLNNWFRNKWSKE